MILAILQARSSSTRFPNKVLADLNGEPMIIRQIDQIGHSRMIDQLVVATSNDQSDDELARLLNSHGIRTHRGSLDDVLSRFTDLIEEFQPDVIVRLTGDCPLTDPTVIDYVIRQHVESGADYTSNTIEPTYPDGLDVECLNPNKLLELAHSSPLPIEKEHVTYGLYQRPNFASINSITQDQDLSDLRWTVDVPEDLGFVRKVYAAVANQNSYITQAKVLDFLQTNPLLSRTNDSLERNIALTEQEKRVTHNE